MSGKNISIILSLLFISLVGLKAQESWSLEKCINHAFDNNISIKRQKLNVEVQKTELKQNKLNQLPGLSASSNYGFNFGETAVRDGSDYVFTTDPIHSISLRVGGSVPVFSGLSQRNTIKKSEKDLLSLQAETERIRNDISLQITSYYLQVLFDKELLNVSKEQYEVSKQQVERTKKLVDAGSQAMGSYLEIKSQAAKEALNVTQQGNSLSLSLLNLAQLLDLEDVSDFDIVYPEIPTVETMNLEDPKSVFNTAIGIMPQIKSSEYSLESSELDVEIAKGGYYPSLSVNYSWTSNGNWYLNDKYDYNQSFSSQISDNKNTYVGATLSIPIFNKLQTRNTVKSAKVGVLDAQYALDQQKLDLRKEIQQAYADALAAYNNYLSSKEAVESYKESFRYTEQKFNVGLVNSVDYNVAKTDFIAAQSDLLQAKYAYILRIKILDFYKGIPITL